MVNRSRLTFPQSCKQQLQKKTCRCISYWLGLISGSHSIMLMAATCPSFQNHLNKLCLNFFSLLFLHFSFFSNCFPWFIILTYQNHIPAYIKKLSLLHSLTSPGKFSVKPQHESAIGIHTFPPFWTFLPSPSPSHLSRLIRARVWVSLAIQQIPVSYLFYIVSMLVFPCVSPSPPHSPCPQVFSMSVFPLLPCK